MGPEESTHAFRPLPLPAAGAGLRGRRRPDRSRDARRRPPAPEAENGVVLQDLAEDGPAARAGLHPGDRLLTVDGTAVDGACALERLLLARSPGQEVTLAVRRGPEILEKPVKLAGALAAPREGLRGRPGRGVLPARPPLRSGTGRDGRPGARQPALRPGLPARQRRRAAPSSAAGISTASAAPPATARILDLVRRACDGGSAAGCAHLAFLYATGRGVPQRRRPGVQPLPGRLRRGRRRGVLQRRPPLREGPRDPAREHQPRPDRLWPLLRPRRRPAAARTSPSSTRRGSGLPGTSHTRPSSTATRATGTPCEEGDPLACFNLGVFYRDGEGWPWTRRGPPPCSKRAATATTPSAAPTSPTCSPPGTACPKTSSGPPACSARPAKGGTPSPAATRWASRPRIRRETVAAPWSRLERACRLETAPPATTWARLRRRDGRPRRPGPRRRLLPAKPAKPESPAAASTSA